MLKRDLSYDLLSRELQALDELFSREPEDGAQWAKRSPPTIPEEKFEPHPQPRPPTPHPKTGKATGATGGTRPIIPSTS